MALRVNNNPPAINAHKNIYLTEKRVNKTTERLSSGLRIVRASDGPASLIISEQMRSQIKGIEQAIRNSETGIAMMQTTESALNEVSRMLTNIQMLAVHAANEAVNDELMLEADQQEINNILSALDRIARDTSFGKRKVLDGTAGVNGVTTGTGLEFVEANNHTKESPPGGFDVVVTEVATRSVQTGTEQLTDDIVRGGERLTIVENGKEATVLGTERDTADTLISKLQAQIDRSGMDVEVFVENGIVTARHKEYGNKTEMFIYSDTSGVLSQEGGNIERAVRGKNIQGTINGELAFGEGRVLRSQKGNRTTDGLAVRYIGNAGTPEGPEIDPDKGYRVGAVNISQNSLRFQFGDSYDENESVSIQSVFSSTLGNGVVNGSDFKSLREIDVRTFEGANDTLKLVEHAQDKISSTRGDIGAFQKNLLEANLNSMMNLRENMIFSESTIRDADMAEESANLTRGQIIQQASLSMMAQAAAEPKNVLKLLQG